MNTGSMILSCMHKYIYLKKGVVCIACVSNATVHVQYLCYLHSCSIILSLRAYFTRSMFFYFSASMPLIEPHTTPIYTDTWKLFPNKKKFVFFPYIIFLQREMTFFSWLYPICINYLVRSDWYLIPKWSFTK